MEQGGEDGEQETGNMEEKRGAGNNKDTTSYKNNQRKAFHGQLVCYIRGKEGKRTASVQFSSPGAKGENGCHTGALVRDGQEWSLIVISSH